MRKIALFCACGMSTSMLVNKMREAAKAAGYECDIEAYSMSALNESGAEADVILLGPQVRYNLQMVKDTCPETPVEAIDMIAYGTMDGKKVLGQARKLLGE